MSSRVTQSSPPRAFGVSEVISWEPIVRSVLEASLDPDPARAIESATERLRATFAAERVAVFAGRRVDALRSIATTPDSGSGPHSLALVREASAAGGVMTRGATLAVVGSDASTAIVVHERRRSTADPAEELSALRCACAWFRSEHRRRPAADELRAAKYESLQHFACRAGHGFKTTLSAITTHAEFALDRIADSHGAHEALEDLVLGARDGLARIDDLMTFAGHLGPPPSRPVELHRLIHGMRPVLRALVPATTELVVSVGRGCMARIRPVNLRQMLVNLVSNAAEALGDDDGTITIEAESTRGSFPTTCIRVRDDGPGMDAYTLSRATDPFFSTRMGRQGLGLAVTLGIARGLGGDLSLGSVPGRGTVVSMVLPFEIGPHDR